MLCLEMTRQPCPLGDLLQAVLQVKDSGQGIKLSVHCKCYVFVTVQEKEKVRQTKTVVSDKIRIVNSTKKFKKLLTMTKHSGIINYVL